MRQLNVGGQRVQGVHAERRRRQVLRRRERLADGLDAAAPEPDAEGTERGRQATKKTLAKLVTAYGLNRQLQTVHGSDTSPSAVGSAFDLTSGPTALLIVLAGTALLLLGGSGMRVWHSRRRA